MVEQTSAGPQGPILAVLPGPAVAAPLREQRIVSPP
jgi:hypothetical protein